jgi:hypothetical protein
MSEIFTETPVTVPAPGQAAYEARLRVKGKHLRYTPRPDWGALSDDLRDEWEAAASAAIDAAGLEDERDKAYRERAALVAYLAACYPSEIVLADDAPGWWIVFVTTPSGQMSWHVSGDDLELFEHLPPATGVTWDGHTTDQKYQRLAELTRTVWNGTAPAEQLRDQIAGLRESFENLAAGLVLSAGSSAPSKKSEIEHGCARAIRGILEHTP